MATENLSAGTAGTHTAAKPHELLQQLAGWMSASGYGADHPWQVAIAATQDSAPAAQQSARDGAAIDKVAGILKRRSVRPIGGNPSPPMLRSLPRFVCKRTVEKLETLLQKAQSGEVVGIAYSVAMPGLKYGVNAVGTFADDPTYARGAVAALDDELRYLVQEAADHEPPQEC